MKKMKKVDKQKVSHKKSSKQKQAQFDPAEIYRQLRTNIEFSSFKKDLNVISVTSTNPSEGKSTVARNLAIIFAVKYENVLFIDCDLRKPVQHKALNTSNSFGVSNITKLIDTVDVNDDSYFKRFTTEEMEGKLYFLPSGSKVPNPQELLSSDKFGELIQKLRERFEYIIIDCPPISRVADAIPLANVSDGTIYVCSAQETNKHEARTGLNELKRNGANIIGCVLTKVDSDYSSYSGYGY